MKALTFGYKGIFAGNMCPPASELLYRSTTPPRYNFTVNGRRWRHWKPAFAVTQHAAEVYISHTQNVHFAAAGEGEGGLGRAPVQVVDRFNID